MQAPQLRREHSYFLPNNALNSVDKEVLMKYYKDELQKLINKSPYKSLNDVPKNSELFQKMQALLETAVKYDYNLNNGVTPLAYSDLPKSDRHAIEALQISLARFVLRTEHPDEDPDVIRTMNELRELYGKYGISMSNSNDSPSYNSRRNNRKTRRGKKRRNTRNTRK